AAPSAPPPPATSTATSTRTPTPTSTVPPPPPPGGPAVAGPISVVPLPTPGAHSLREITILAVAINHLEIDLRQRRTAPVQAPPPVQVPSVADGLYDMVAAAFGAAQPSPTGANPCDMPVISMSSSVAPGMAAVGEPVNFTY